MSRLTTHVLDNTRGRPAEGMRVALFRLGEGAETLVSEAHTNADGRCATPMLEGEAFQHGSWELRFHVGEYYTAQGVPVAQPPFLDIVPVRFHLADGNYHIPLLVTPWSYSTYRGS